MLYTQTCKNLYRYCHQTVYFRQAKFHTHIHTHKHNQLAGLVTFTTFSLLRQTVRFLWQLHVLGTVFHRPVKDAPSLPFFRSRLKTWHF